MPTAERPSCTSRDSTFCEVFEVSPARPGKSGLVLSTRIDLVDGLPELRERRSAALVVPHARSHRPVGTGHTRHLTQSGHRVGHEVHHQLCHGQVELIVVVRKFFGVGLTDVDCRQEDHVTRPAR